MTKSLWWRYYDDNGDHVMDIFEWSWWSCHGGIITYLNDICQTICLKVRLHCLSKCFTKAWVLECLIEESIHNKCLSNNFQAFWPSEDQLESSTKARFKIWFELIGQVTDKTRADIKGGTLIQYEGKVIFLFWISSKSTICIFQKKEYIYISNISTLDKIF